MQKHTINYFDFFNIDYDIPTGWHDYIDCEMDKKQVTDIHHIKFKSQGGKDNIGNLIALCRECHLKAHAGTISRSDLQRVHDINVLKNT